MSERRFTYNIFTPFCRWQNLIPFTNMLHRERVRWHPILDGHALFTFLADWIYPSLYPGPMPEGWFPGHAIQNWWIENRWIYDTHRYAMLSDDDMYEEGFIDKIDAVDGDVLIATMLREHAGHGTLVACAENVKGGSIGGEQIIVTGAVLKQFRFGPSGMGDWDFIKAVTDKYPAVFVPDAKVYWNKLDNRKGVLT